MIYCYHNGRSIDHQMPVCLSEKKKKIYINLSFASYHLHQGHIKKSVYFSLYACYTITRGQPFLLLTNRQSPLEVVNVPEQVRSLK